MHNPANFPFVQSSAKLLHKDWIEIVAQILAEMQHVLYSAAESFK